MSYLKNAIHELTDFFLGENFYIPMPVSHEQATTEIVYEIETKYRHKQAGKKWFQRSETDDEICKRLSKVCEPIDCGLCSSPMKDDKALNELARFFLGTAAYTVSESTDEQKINEIVAAIKSKAC